MSPLPRIVLGVCLLVLSLMARAQSAPQDFDVPPQALSQVLEALRTQAGLQPFYAEANVGATRSPGVHGRYTLREALAQALAGTGLSYEFTGEKSVAIRRGTAAPAPVTLPTLEIHGTLLEEDAGSYVSRRSSVATKTETPLMETPTKVEVVTQQAIQDMGLQSQGLTQVMAALGIAGLGIGDGALDEGFFYRGFQTSTKLWNGFRIETLGVANANGGTWLGNVERVDMLRGASAILYGRAEPGGAINISTKKPRETFGGSVSTGLGNYSNRWVAADLGGPLNASGTLLFRLNADHETEASRYRYGEDYRSSGVAPALEFRLTPQTVLSLEGQFRNLEGSSNQPYMPVDPVTGRLAKINPDLTLMPGAGSEFRQRRVLAGLAHRFSEDWQLKWKFMHNDARQPFNLWSTITGMFYPQNPGDPLLYSRWLTGAIGDSGQSVSASLLELTGRFQTGTLRHTLLLGADYYRTHTREDGINNCFNCEQLDYNHPPAFVLGNELPLFNNYGRPDSYYRLTQKEPSLYVQDQIQLPHQVHVLLGGRYQHLKERSYFVLPPTDYGSPTGPDGVIDCDDGNGGPCYVEDIPTKLTNFLPRAAILWQPLPVMSSYYSYTANSGASQGLDVNNRPIPPEKARQHELGAKFELMDSRLIASAALFDLAKTNVITTVNGLVFPTGEVQSRGFELSAQGAITAGWNVLTTYNYARPKVTKLADPAYGGVNGGNATFMAPQGSKLPYQSERAFSALTSYRLPFELLQGFRIGGSYNWFSAPVMDRNSSVKSDAYQVVSAFASYEKRMGRYTATAQLNVDNLFDEEYLLYQGDFGVALANDPQFQADYQSLAPANYTAGNYVGGNWGAPRQVRASLRLSF